MNHDFSIFEAASIGDKYTVIDSRTGRQMTARLYDTRQQANGLAYGLNQAAAKSSQFMLRKLGAI